MFDAEDFFSFILGLVIVAVVAALAVFAFAALITVGGIGGLAWGGGTAVKNYFSSVKENIIDSNRQKETAA